MRIKELFEAADSGSLIGKIINGKLITKDTENEFWDKSFDCSSKDTITSFEGAPRKIKGYFSCSYNKNITSLKGMPQEGVKGIWCAFCKNLTSLEGAPKKINGDLNCVSNLKLSSLKGMPQEGVDVLNCANCNLTSLEGAPKKINGNIYCNGNPIVTLKNIHKIFEEVNGAIEFPDSIESNILGLLKIKNLTSISFKDKLDNRTKINISGIINKYLPNPTPDQIIDCQNELIDAGFEEYAEL